jgi:hypothetical protein
VFGCRFGEWLILQVIHCVNLLCRPIGLPVLWFLLFRKHAYHARVSNSCECISILQLYLYSMSPWPSGNSICSIFKDDLALRSRNCRQTGAIDDSLTWTSEPDDGLYPFGSDLCWSNLARWIPGRQSWSPVKLSRVVCLLLLVRCKDHLFGCWSSSAFEMDCLLVARHASEGFDVCISG